MGKITEALQSYFHPLKGVAPGQKVGKVGKVKIASYLTGIIPLAASAALAVTKIAGMGKKKKLLKLSIYSKEQKLKIKTREGKVYVGIVKGIDFEVNTITVGEHLISIDQIDSGELI